VDGVEDENNEKEIGCKEKVIDCITPPPCPWTFAAYLRLFFLLVVIGLFIAAIIFRDPLGKFLGQNGPLRKFVDMIGWYGPLVYVAVYVIATVLMIPGTVLTLAAGVIFRELWLAFVTISIGSTIGATMAYLLGKSVLRAWVSAKVQEFPIFRAIDSAISRRGLFMVLLLRLSPVLPFNILNYGLSVTGISFFEFMYGSWVGMAPGTFMYIYIPWAAINAATSTSSAELISKIITYGIGAVVTILVVVVVTIVAKRAIDQEMKEMKDKEELQANIENAKGSVNSS